MYFTGEMNSIGEVRCLIPSDVNIIALTAIATLSTFHVVSQRLSLQNPVIVALSPNRVNIKLVVQSSKSLREFTQFIASKLKQQQIDYPKTIIFACNYQDCTNLYLNIGRFLEKQITYPVGYPNLLKYRLLSMYTRASTDMKAQSCPPFQWRPVHSVLSLQKHHLVL